MDFENDRDAVGNAQGISPGTSCLLFMLSISASWGLCIGLFSSDSDIVGFLEYAAPLLLLSCGVVWCYLDSYRYDVFLTQRFYLFLLLFFAVAFPCYVFRTRGLSGFITIGGSLLFVSVCYVLVFAGTGLGVVFASIASGV